MTFAQTGPASILSERTSVYVQGLLKIIPTRNECERSQTALGHPPTRALQQQLPMLAVQTGRGD
jgi:hypothetical protein